MPEVSDLKNPREEKKEIKERRVERSEEKEGGA